MTSSVFNALQRVIAYFLNFGQGIPFPEIRPKSVVLSLQRFRAAKSSFRTPLITNMCLSDDLSPRGGPVGPPSERMAKPVLPP